MMNKFLILAVFGLVIGMVSVFGVGSVSAAPANQGVSINGTEVINFTVNSIDFGNVIPGNNVSSNSVITLDVSNNINFSVSICLGETSDFPFNNTVLDFSNVGGTVDTGITLCNSGGFDADITDTDGPDLGIQQNVNIPMSLYFPIGIGPGLRTGTIVYTITTTFS